MMLAFAFRLADCFEYFNFSLIVSYPLNFRLRVSGRHFNLKLTLGRNKVRYVALYRSFLARRKKRFISRLMSCLRNAYVSGLAAEFVIKRRRFTNFKFVAKVHS